MSLLRIVPLLLFAAAAFATAAERTVINFNPDWKFLQADPTGAAAPGLNDAAWTTVSTPHTFNDVDPFDHGSTPGHRGEQIPWSGRTWYRKTFDAPAAWQGKQVFIEFEAVREAAEVYLNGVLLGTARGGFAPFGFDLTPHLKIGTANLLAVRVDPRVPPDPPAAPISRPNPHRHPADADICRNVRLIVTDPLHVALSLFSFLQTDGPYAYATEISEKSAMLGIEVPVRNDRPLPALAKLHAAVIDATGRTVLQLDQTLPAPAGGECRFKLSGLLLSPRLWEPAYPYLYQIHLTLAADGLVVDDTSVPLGIRAIRWTPDQGVFVNGAHLTLHGWDQTPGNEWPGLGAALPDWLHFYTAQLMKNAGGNFVRWSYAPAGPAQIESSDRLGLITVQPGADSERDTGAGDWLRQVADFRDTLIYCRNHPSIFIWAGGNQTLTRAHTAELREIMDRYDPHGGRVFAQPRGDAASGGFMEVSISSEGGRATARLPVVDRNSEHEESPRRVWDNFSPAHLDHPKPQGQTRQLTSEQFAVDGVARHIRAFGVENPVGGADRFFSDCGDGDRVAGEVARTRGEVDGVRLPKEAYYVRSVMYRDNLQVHIIGHWTYPAGTRKTVYVAANGDDVELFLNGASLGHGQVSDRYLFTFPNLAFAPGELKAVASREGKVIATASVHTVGPAVALRLRALSGPGGLRADGEDVLLVDIEAVDALGDRVPTFQRRVDFSLSGPAEWAGGSNRDKVNSSNQVALDLDAGINRVALRAGREPGKITLTARCDGLRSADVSTFSVPFTGALPALPAVTLPVHAPVRHIGRSAHTASGATPGEPAPLGRFVRTLTYTGPNAAIVHVEINAAAGKNAYVNVDSAFPGLPAELAGADWVQVDNRDARCRAAVLLEFTVAAPATVTIAHDHRLPIPAWLNRPFKATGHSIIVLGQAMDLFVRTAAAGERITLGANADDPLPPGENLYLVFVNGR